MVPITDLALQGSPAGWSARGPAAGFFDRCVPTGASPGPSCWHDAEMYCNNAGQVRRPSMDFASHPREGRLGEVCQARIALLVTCQHSERHQTVQHGTRIRHSGAQSVPDGAEHRVFFGLQDDLEHGGAIGELARSSCS